MSVRLYEGCWGVTRGGEVVGPFKHVHRRIFWVDLRGKWWEDGEMRDAVTQKTNDRLKIIAVFPSEAAARAWLDRKPWWRLALKYMNAETKSRRWLDWAAMFMGLMWILALLSACATAPRDYPHGPRCESDYGHTHVKEKK